MGDNASDGAWQAQVHRLLQLGLTPDQIYPVGSTWRMRNGDVGTVTGSGKGTFPVGMNPSRLGKEIISLHRFGTYFVMDGRHWNRHDFDIMERLS